MTDIIKYSGDEFEKNSHWKDQINHLSELTQKHILKLFPGGEIVEDILNYQSELNKKRTVGFVNDLINKILDEYGNDLSFEDLKNESFSDLLNRVLQKIQNTNSEFKKNRFRDILILKFEIKSEDLLFEKFVDLLDKVNDIQIIILKELSENDQFKFGVGAHKGTEIIKSYIDKIERKVRNRSFIEFLAFYCSKDKKSENEFFILELASLGLIKTVPSKGGFDSYQRSQSPKYMNTEIGEKFLSFIIKN